MDIRIRRAEKDDYGELMNLYGDFVNDPPRFSSTGNDSYLKFIDTPNTFMDLALVDNKIIGFIAYTVRTVVRYPNPIKL